MLAGGIWKGMSGSQKTSCVLFVSHRVYLCVLWEKTRAFLQSKSKHGLFEQLVWKALRNRPWTPRTHRHTHLPEKGKCVLWKHARDHTVAASLPALPRPMGLIWCHNSAFSSVTWQRAKKETHLVLRFFAFEKLTTVSRDSFPPILKKGPRIHLSFKQHINMNWNEVQKSWLKFTFIYCMYACMCVCVCVYCDFLVISDTQVHT